MRQARGTPHVFLFRAVNVGGTAKLPMAELRALATELGASEVQTYIASGNLIATPPGDPNVFARQLKGALEARFGSRARSSPVTLWPCERRGMSIRSLSSTRASRTWCR